MLRFAFSFIILGFVIMTMLGQNKKPNLYQKLGKDIELKAVPAYPDEDIQTFHHLRIYQNGKCIYRDTSSTEYTKDNPLYPKLYEFKTHKELLVETDNRPNMNMLFNFHIQNERIIRIDTIPDFKNAPKDLDGDNKPEFTGQWDHSEHWGDSVLLTGYNPVMYYELTDDGIVLDKTTTIKINTKFYGKFYGFEYNSEIAFPEKELEKNNEETDTKK